MNVTGTNASTFNDRQKEFMAKYAALVMEYADKKITCFSEHIIPVSKLDIEFICTD